MLVAALTGGIATGKSVVAKILKDLGCYVYHADQAAHRLMAPGQPSWKEIVFQFGKEILNPDQTINRQKLGIEVFSDRNKRLFLNNLLHPLVFKKEKDLIIKLDKEKRYKIFVSEAALTIEAGFADFFDKIIVVNCPKEIQLKRLMERDHITREKALNKMESQLPQEEKLKYADYIIDTSGSLSSTVEQIEHTFRNLMVDYELKAGSGL